MVVFKIAWAKMDVEKKKNIYVYVLSWIGGLGGGGVLLNSFELDSDVDSIDFERLVAPDHPRPYHPKPCSFSSVNPKQDDAWPFRNIVNTCIYVYVT